MQVRILINFYLFLISHCFSLTNSGLKVRIFLIVKWLKVSFRVDISKIFVHAVIPPDSAFLSLLDLTWKSRKNGVQHDLFWQKITHLSLNLAVLCKGRLILIRFCVFNWNIFNSQIFKKYFENSKFPLFTSLCHLREIQI